MEKKKLSAVLTVASLLAGGAKLVIDHFNEPAQLQEAAEKAVKEAMKKASK